MWSSQVIKGLSCCEVLEACLGKALLDCPVGGSLSGSPLGGGMWVNDTKQGLCIGGAGKLVAMGTPVCVQETDCHAWGKPMLHCKWEVSRVQVEPPIWIMALLAFGW